MKSPSSSANQPKDVQAPGTKPSNILGSAAAQVRRLPSWLLGLVCVALSALAAFAAFEIFFPVRVPAAMRGKWVVVEGKDLKGSVLEFFANGRMVGTSRPRGRKSPSTAGSRSRGNRFRVTTAGPSGGVVVTELEEILDLTDRRFVVQDSRGEVLIMERPPAAGAATAGGAR